MMLHCWHGTKSPPDPSLPIVLGRGDPIECCHCQKRDYYLCGEPMRGCQGRPITLTAADLRSIQMEEHIKLFRDREDAKLRKQWGEGQKDRPVTDARSPAYKVQQIASAASYVGGIGWDKPAAEASE